MSSWSWAQDAPIQTAPVEPPPPPLIPPPEVDCSLEIWRNAAICSPQGLGNVPPPVVNPDGSLNCANPVNVPTVQCSGGAPTSQDCSLPQNAALPFCVNSQPLNNSDGSVNCAQPQNATSPTCMELFKPSTGGQLDCSRPELQNMPICINNGNVPVPPMVVNPDGSLNCANPVNATTIQCAGGTATSQDCSLPENAALPFCVQNQPMYNTDGSLNCAQPSNATMATCMDLFMASSNGQLDCAQPELQNIPICRNNSNVPSVTAGPTAQSGPINSTGAVTATASSTITTPAPSVSAPVTLPNNAPQKASEKVSKTKEELFAEDDGEEEPPVGTLEVSYSSAISRYVVKVECNLAGEKLTVRAVKKGAKALRFSISIDEDGVGGVRTKSKLAGYTLTLYYGTTKLDQVRVK